MSALFLLVPNVADELTQAMLTLTAAWNQTPDTSAVPSNAQRRL